MRVPQAGAKSGPIPIKPAPEDFYTAQILALFKTRRNPIVPTYQNNFDGLTLKIH
jgi:hypothetical protein